MTRRTALVSLIGLALMSGADAQPSGKVARVGFIMTTSPVAEAAGSEPINPAPRGALHGLRALGWIEGRNLIFERRSLEGHWDRLPHILAELARNKTDVIMIPGGLVPEAVKTGGAVPFVAAGSEELLLSGVVRSLSRPEGNVTGVLADVDAGTDAKRLQLLFEILDRPLRIAFLGTKRDWENEFGKNVRALALKAGVRLVHAEGATTDFSGAFEAIREQKPDAFFVARSPTAFGFRHQIADFAVSSRVASSCPAADHVEAGCLMSYGPNIFDLFRRAAGHVDKILKGAKPGDLPIERPSTYEFVVNLKTAKALGLEIPAALLVRADRVIQ